MTLRIGSDSHSSIDITYQLCEVAYDHVGHSSVRRAIQTASYSQYIMCVSDLYSDSELFIRRNVSLYCQNEHISDNRDNSVIVCFAAFNSIDLPYGLSRDTLQSVAEYAGALLGEFSSKEDDNDYGIYSHHLTFPPVIPHQL